MTKVHDSLSDVLVNVFETNEILHWLPDDEHVRLGGVLQSLLLRIVVLIIVALLLLAAHIVEEGHLDAEEGLLGQLEFNAILFLNTVISGYEVGLDSLASELVLFFEVTKIFVDFFNGIVG